MHFLMTPLGSHGDVHPFIGIGRELRDRGHEVTLITAEPFREAIGVAGLEWVENGSNEEFDVLTSNADLWHPLRGMPRAMQAVVQNLERLHARLEEHYRPGETVLVGHSLGLATRAFEEQHAAPAATLHLAPAIFRSDYEMPAIAPGLRPSWLPRPAKRLFFWTLDRLMLDHKVTGPLNEFRRGLGLAPVQRLFCEHVHSPQRVIGLFPEWFGRPQSDWPSQCRLTGFPLFDGAQERPLQAELQAFLARGPAPLLATPGSANAHAKKLMGAALEGARRLGQRVILATRYPKNLPAHLPTEALHVHYAPFSQLLPHCSAIVHHGGIGTLAQALAAGIPQLITPLTFDQPDNATRLHELGVGAFVGARRITGAKLARALTRLLERPALHERCAEYRTRITEAKPLELTCQWLEAVFDEHRRAH